MRTLLAIAILGGGILALYDPADAAARKRTTSPRADTYTAQPRPIAREVAECERARHEDPTGRYAGYPCWAREALGRGSRGSDH